MRLHLDGSSPASFSCVTLSSTSDLTVWNVLPHTVPQTSDLIHESWLCQIHMQTDRPFLQILQSGSETIENKGQREREVGGKQRRGETKGKRTANIRCITAQTCHTSIPNCLGTLNSLCSQLVCFFPPYLFQTLSWQVKDVCIENEGGPLPCRSSVSSF